MKIKLFNTMWMKEKSKTDPEVQSLYKFLMKSSVREKSRVWGRLRWRDFLIEIEARNWITVLENAYRIWLWDQDLINKNSMPAKASSLQYNRAKEVTHV